MDIFDFRISADSHRICLGPNRVPDLLDVPTSNGTPTKQASRPEKSMDKRRELNCFIVLYTRLVFHTCNMSVTSDEIILRGVGSNLPKLYFCVSCTLLPVLISHTVVLLIIQKDDKCVFQTIGNCTV